MPAPALRDRRHARWLSRTLRGDARAFRRLYDELYPDIEGYVARRVAAPADRDDLVASCFERMLDRADQFDARRGSVRMWVFGIARHLVLDHHRGARRRAGPLDPEALERDATGMVGAEAGASQSDPLAQLLRDEGLGRLRALVLGLDEQQRELLALRYGDELSHVEIAALVGAEPAAVRQRLSRLRKTLREQLARPADLARVPPLKGAPENAY